MTKSDVGLHRFVVQIREQNSCEENQIHRYERCWQGHKLLDTSKLKEFADDNFKYDENGRVLYKGRNTGGKGEIAH